MNDVLFATLIAFTTAALMKVIENVLERRKAGASDRRADETSALSQVQAVWQELRKLKEDHQAEIDEMRAEHAADIAELRTVVELHKHRTGQAERRALLAEQERDQLLRELGPLKIEVEALRKRVRDLEEVKTHG